MHNFVTLYAFTFPSDLIAIKGRLESEGIECKTQDELTVQVHNFYSNAIGGVRLQVKEQDYEKAKAILIEAGYTFEEEKKENEFWVKVNKLTQNIPLFNSLRVELRLLLLTGSILFIILFSLFSFLSYINRTPPVTTYQYITNARWCLNYIDYKGVKYAPKTISDNKIVLVFYGDCIETLSFHNNKVYFPGFNTKAISGNWKLINDEVIISDLDTLEDVLSARYKVIKEKHRLILKSDSISIHCYNGFY